MYLYNLSNSPVLISEGPPSIYLDYPCPSAASFLPLLLLLGCVCVRAVLHLLPPGVVCALPGRALPGIVYGNDRTLCGREERSFVPFGQVLRFQCWVGCLTAPHCLLPGSLQQTPQTPFSVPFMLDLKLQLVSQEKGDHLSKVTILLRLCFRLQPPLSEWEGGLGRISTMTPSAFLDK